MSNLHRMRSGMTGRCDFCDKEESVEHMLLECEWARSLWFGFCGIRTSMDDGETIDVWLASRFKQMSPRGEAGKEVLTRIVFMLWHIWK